MNGIALPRREIIKQFILGSVSSWLAGSTWTQRVLADVNPYGDEFATLKVKLSQFTALQSAGGSVRLSVGLDYPVSINRGTSNDFYAVNTDCAHNHCTVNSYDPNLVNPAPFPKGAMRCSCHGSRYGIDGSLVNGPAATGLKSYPATFNGSDTVSVVIPGVTFTVRNISVQSLNAGSMRLKLTFKSLFFTSYQVEYRQNLTDAPTVIPFSLSPTGSATQTTYYRTTINATEPFPTDLYVDVSGARGFFSIALLPEIVL